MGLCLDRQAVIAVGTIHVEPKGKIIREMPSDGARIIVEDYCCGGWKPTQQWLRVTDENGAPIEWTSRNIRQHVAWVPCSPASPTEPPASTIVGKA